MSPVDESIESTITVLWFRHGLRLHDNPALIDAINNCKLNNSKLLPIFIFDGETAGTKIVGYNRLKFLLDSLNDLDRKFQQYNGRLTIAYGDPVYIFRQLNKYLKLNKICFEQDCEPIWKLRDDKVKDLCRNELMINYEEKISHTLWNPQKVIETNGGIPPLTYQMFLHTVEVIGLPPRPAPDPNWTDVKFCILPDNVKQQMNIYDKIPEPSDFNIHPEFPSIKQFNNWIGGEEKALELLCHRLKVEENAFQNNYYMPNQAIPNILDESKSMSPHLRFGCLSIRTLYWALHDIYKQIQKAKNFPVTKNLNNVHITGQLIWREYFYTMSVNNINYDKMEDNNICLNIPWRYPTNTELEKWKFGKTGFPLIDASARQLLSEGWIHHILRNTVASFLTRGGLWISWEFGLEHFLKYLLDADWSVCAGNWMWISSSAFENLLDSSKCTCPIALSKKLDPNGDYIKRYIPELRSLPVQYIHEPWKTPKDLQEHCGCVIGIDYPERMIDLDLASKQNNIAMNALRKSLLASGVPDHVRPSCEEEIMRFFSIV
ncbi:cryptochrome-1 [Condylostylus longicornis]|uniref:cryptochrome-1 n=1 Tax=Condylostylus longicornis TaxID=2530218 RepID=UPI00244E57BD|nr:cryptochrome-1 [Condylostylus longicornis]